ncbi:MAG: hypothetical protein ACM3MN_04795, partial [Nitrospirota bacterium]
AVVLQEELAVGLCSRYGFTIRGHPLFLLEAFSGPCSYPSLRPAAGRVVCGAKCIRSLYLI